MALTPNEIRKKMGCWGCLNSCISNVEIDAEISCNHEDESIRAGFEGWESALTCKGFKMKPCTVDVFEKKEET